MRTLATLATATLIAAGLASTAAAGPPVVVLTGGGIVQNNDSGLGDAVAIGGFVAIARGEGVPGPNDATVWNDVKGQLQSKLVAAADPTKGHSSNQDDVRANLQGTWH